MKRRLKELAILGAVLAVIGLIVLVSGVFPIKASSGHWAVTNWVLDFASDRSIAFHSRGIDVPALDEPGMVLLGAATYESNCRFCHGRPDQSQPPVAQGLTPTPPVLTNSVPQFESQELFYIVKHGIKFAGMPAWPTQQRDDEIWPMVAFLSRYPELSHDAYRNLIRSNWATEIADTEGNESKVAGLVSRRCAACHGMRGNGRAGRRVPLLAGQNAAYLRQALFAYHSGERVSGVMMPIAHRLSTQEIDAMADYFSQQERSPERHEVDDEQSLLDQSLIERGRELALNGDRGDKIASCADCHGPGDRLRENDYPILAGQPAVYLEQQLKLFANRHRGGSKNATIMHPISDKLSDEQRSALAAYYQSLR